MPIPLLSNLWQGEMCTKRRGSTTLFILLHALTLRADAVTPTSLSSSTPNKQHELETSLCAHRYVISRVINHFQPGADGCQIAASFTVSAHTTQNALTSVDAKLRRDDDRDEKNAETRAGTMKDDDGDRAKEKHQRSREPRSKREIRARRKAKERARMCLYREQVRHQTSKAAGSHNGAPTTGSECREQICRGAAAGASVREEVRRLLRKPENERDTNKGDGGLLSPLDRGMSGLPRLVLQPTSPGISLSLGPVGTNGLDLREIGQHGRSETGAREACGANHDDRARSKNDSQREKSIGATATRPRDACREGGVDGGDDHVADDVVARSPTSPCEEEDTPRGKRGCDVPVKSVAVLLPLDSVKGGTARGDPPAGYLREGRISQHLARPKEMQDTVQERAADEEHEKRRCLADLGVGAGGYPPKQQDVEEGAALGGSDCAQSDYATDEFEDTDDDSVRSVS